MVLLSGCRRCDGAVLNDSLDGPLCVNCGWYEVSIPEDVRVEIKTYMGRRVIGNSRAAMRIGTGKPPLSGWEKELRRREREADELQGENLASR